ncbi:aldehyde dehydrogenase family protein [Pseudomonas brassicacearum]|nr:aldehyde dehydrogenase family protein [Pseudomonas sp. URIL14HWK12:I7]
MAALVGRGLVEPPGTDKVSFTGSIPTGIAIGESAMGARLTQTTLELDENSARFLRDVELARAVSGIIEAEFLNPRKICATSKRFSVHRFQLNPIMDELPQCMGKLNISSPPG